MLTQIIVQMKFSSKIQILFMILMENKAVGKIFAHSFLLWVAAEPFLH